MLKDRVYVATLFFTSAFIAIYSGFFDIEPNTYLKTLGIYWLFSTLYSHQKIVHKKGNTYIDYGISYSSSIALFTGPLGLFIFQTLYQFTVYLIRKWTKTDDPHEFVDTLYNIGSFTIGNIVAFIIYYKAFPLFENIPFGFWILIVLLTATTSLMTDIFLIGGLFLLGEIRTLQDAIHFVKTRSILDTGKLALTNGLLFLLLQEGKWEMLIILFILNYVVSSSFLSKSQNAQNKLERDKFEQMAYTDFLTGVSNRAFMNKVMVELNEKEEWIGIVVADIDKFKRINDSFNHAVGDSVIQHFATTINNHLEPNDYLFRSGGEEFTFFLLDRDFNQCLQLVEKIQHQVESSTLTVEFKDRTVPLSYTASFGLFFNKINEEMPIEKGYVYADHLLIQSKQQGRNRISTKIVY